MKKILIIDDNEMLLGLINYCLMPEYELFLCQTPSEAQSLFEKGVRPDAIVTDLNFPEENGKDFLIKIKNSPLYSQIPLLVLSGNEKSETRIDCLKLGADDYLVKPFHPEELKLRIAKQFEKQSQSIALPKLDIGGETNIQKVLFPTPKSSFRKRIFDITLAGSALIFLSPLFILVAILIKIDSKGPVLFLSKRIGAGYKVFELYKFRTMRTGAEKEIKNISHLNMYNADIQIVNEESDGNLIDDLGWKNEENLIHKKANDSAFLKFKNDPRITRLGAFLRNTSIDELPQLINIIKGDMSLVGNRPLPLYEAEKLTTDESAARFLAPAGLTGLWQVTKRGKGEVSAKERQDLDNTYSLKHNWKFDLGLIARTFPALLQSEKV